jgi:hypothetical protein
MPDPVPYLILKTPLGSKRITAALNLMNYFRVRQRPVGFAATRPTLVFSEYAPASGALNLLRGLTSITYGGLSAQRQPYRHQRRDCSRYCLWAGNTLY